MGERISQIIPSIYYHEENDLIRFVKALDVEVDILERQIAGITDLINVDKCPDDKLIYLAALTNCPLVGNDPAIWRKQIKNWPYILKMKGTERSLDLYLNSIEIDQHKIYTFFRDAEGNLVEDKPDGEPFEGDDGLWYNIRTHYFDLDIIYGEDHALTWTEWHKDFLKKIDIWLTRGKPFHAELRNLRVYIDRKTDQNIYHGAIIGQSVNHDIALILNNESDTSQDIAVATTPITGINHDLGLFIPVRQDEDLRIYSAAGVFQGITHSLGILTQTQSQTMTELITGCVISCGAEFNISMAA
ncbi:MAG: hypothetical protein IJQ56_08160 [Synergistaceae bacterium]|nr:hypothetical protein [Synergistaceae bacterium]